MLKSGEDRNIYEDVGHVDDPNHFPVSDDKPFLLYQLIQKFAENFTTSTDEISGKAYKISHCSNGHSPILFDNLNNKTVGETKSSDHIICDGCVQPILSPPDYFYGCLDCNFTVFALLSYQGRFNMHYIQNTSSLDVIKLGSQMLSSFVRPFKTCATRCFTVVSHVHFTLILCALHCPVRSNMTLISTILNWIMTAGRLVIATESCLDFKMASLYVKSVNIKLV
ncbi:hypothetical protein POM88_024604 [Heracleum sosnowskyi]|uniref:Uncharacterized protein n=1 Tax=Heracleum sosnowskyi TaxID=360622 RepID=A0AAD8I5F8_9APIA|nr:hypothetical protein POM88_024604 [Heracleum sosnowskyi]